MCLLLLLLLQVVGEDVPLSAAVIAVAIVCLCCFSCRCGYRQLGRSSCNSAVAAAVYAGGGEGTLTSAADDTAVDAETVGLSSTISCCFA
jgi:hypothetical protein